jgi:fatty-acyl-CoA synthase
MRLNARIRREIRFLKALSRTLKRVQSISSGSANLACDDFEAAVDEHRARPAVSFEGHTLSYAEFDALANRYAHWAQENNLRRGAVVALVIPNRLEYCAIWLGLSKVGVVTALINNQLTGPALHHCLATCGAAHILVDEETLDAVEEVRGDLKNVSVWTLGPTVRGDHRNLAQALRSVSALRPDRSVRQGLTARDLALYIFTSGTTGLPKAARISHARLQLYMRGFAAATNAGKEDRIYVCLPLYHATGGLCGVGAAWMNGGLAVIGRRFHASTSGLRSATCAARCSSTSASSAATSSTSRKGPRTATTPSA